MDKPLKFSLNIDFLNKHPKPDLSGHQNQFKNIEGTLAELAEAIKAGEAFSYQFHFEERKTSNFLCSDIIVIDINDGRTITQALKNPLIQSHSSLLYTTINHTPDKHRLRLIFVLPKTIDDVKQFKAATKSLARRLGADMTTTDGARMFYGCKDGYQQIFDNKISNELLDELIADGLTETDSDSITNRSTISKSKHTLKPYFQLKTRKGDIVKFADFRHKTNVYCPFHHDENAIAFVNLNHQSIPYLFCAYCQYTRWLEGYKSKFDFDGFEKIVREYIDNPPLKNAKPVSPLAQFLYDEIPSWHESIHFTKNEFLKIPKIDYGLTFIKSPKGSGKTFFLKQHLDKLILNQNGSAFSLENFANELDQDLNVSIYNDKKVLLIGHRQALISEMCSRLGLICYLDVKNTRELAKGNNPNYGVCLDSLCTALEHPGKWDLIIIDESEQVLSHLLSETLGDKRTEIFNQLNTLVKNAKSVIALDADLGWITFNTLTRMTKAKSESVTPINIYINEWQSNQEPIFIYPAASQLIDHLKQSIIDGKKVFVSSNSKSKIQSLEKSIQDLAADLNIQIPMIAITSENSKSIDCQKFIANIKTEIKQFQVILSSPSLGTGIDITFLDNAKEIDCVYGLFENRINSHFEIDQQLRRVRHPKEVHVWISPTWYNFETEFEVVKDEYLNNNFLINLYYEQVLESDPLKISNKFIGNFLMMATLITVYQRASKNNLKRNFIQYKQSEGFQIVEVPHDEDLMKAGRDFYKIGLNLLSEQNIAETLKSLPLTKKEYEAIIEKLDSNDKEVTRGEFYSLKRTKLELFYRATIDRKMIVDDEKYKLRRGISAYEFVTNIDRIKDALADKYSSFMNLREQGIYEKILPSKSSAALLLHDLFTKTPIFRDNSFQPWIEYTSSNLMDFIKHVIKHKSFIENHLRISIRTDISIKPAQQLGQLLKEVGLGHWYAKSRVKKGQKIYYYKLDPDKLRNVSDIVARRNKYLVEWDFYNDMHKFALEDLE
ncbi:MAG: plasmid replication protein, CyRepA1 family [Pseudomonadota bacterium]